MGARNICWRACTSRYDQPDLPWEDCSELTENKKRTIVRSPPDNPDAIDTQPQSDADQLEAAANQAIAACGGDPREAVKALIVANQFFETDLEKLKAAVSMGYARGKLFEDAKTLPRDRKDWYD